MSQYTTGARRHRRWGEMWTGLWLFGLLVSTVLSCASAPEGEAKGGGVNSGSEPDLPSRLQAHVDYLAGDLGERNPVRYEQLEQARHYIECSFTGAGYQIRHDDYDVGGSRFRNILADKEAAPGQDPLLIVGAHYDSASGTPGADDNASGVAVLLELARLLRTAESRCRLRWAAFTLEEPPYFRSPSMGSWVHARKCGQRGEEIFGMLSLEMVGYYRDEPRSQQYPLPLMRWFYPDQGDYIAVAGDFHSRSLVGQLTRLLRETGAIPVESIALPFVPGVGLSDNWSFWQEGYRALMITDTAFHRNPHYHRPSDLPETLDYARMAQLVEALAQALPSMGPAG